MKKNNNKGFTLMEMLIVVAIIAVLVAIAIPVFTNQLEKAREATDMANIRSAYAEVMASVLTDTQDGSNDVHYDKANGGTWTKTVTAVQTKDGWQTGTVEIAGQTPEAVTKDNTWTIEYKTEGNTNGNATISKTK